jgi:hypothetical protein
VEGLVAARDPEGLLLVSLALAASVSFTFRGGVDYELAELLQVKFKAPVVMLADPDRKWPTINEEEESLNKLRLTVISSSGGDGTALQSSTALSPKNYPLFFFLKQAVTSYHSRYKTKGDLLQLNAGSLTSTVKRGEAITLHQLSNFKKHLTWHWFFNDVRLIIDAKNVKSQYILEALPAAIGASLVERSDTYYLDFKPELFRKRVTALMNSKWPIREDAMVLADKKYMLELYKWISDADLLEIYSDPGNQKTLPAKVGSPLHRAAIARFWALVGGKDPKKRNASQTALADRYVPNIDLSGTCQVIVSASGVPSVGLFNKQGNHRVVF